MKAIKFDKMLKEVGPVRLLGRFYNNKVFLTSKQVDLLIKLKNEVEKC